MRSAAAKAAAARRKAAKEAAAQEAAAAEAAAAEAVAAEASALATGADRTEAPEVHAAVPIDGASSGTAAAEAASTDVVPPEDTVPADAPGDAHVAAGDRDREPVVASDPGPVSESPVPPPLPTLSAEEAAAVFARVPERRSQVEVGSEPAEADAPVVVAESPAAGTDRVKDGDTSGDVTDDAADVTGVADAVTADGDSLDRVESPSGAPFELASGARPTAGHGLLARLKRLLRRDADSRKVAPPSSGAATSAPPMVDAPSPDRAVGTRGEGYSDRQEGADLGSERHDETETEAAADLTDSAVVLAVSGLTKSFGDTRAVDALDLEVRAGTFYGIVGPNGAGKTTTLSMVTGLLRPDSGSVVVNGVDVWADPAAAKRTIGVLPDRLRVFDRLTGAQLLYYSGTLRGLEGDVVRRRVDDLARAFGLEDAMGRLVSDYSAGMVKKVSLAAAMIHSPRILVLDEPFESVDPVSSARIVEILRVYVNNGGTVVLSSHSMDFIERVCDDVAIIVEGEVLAAGSVGEVRGNGSLEDRFLELAGGRRTAEGMEWLHSFSG